MTCATYVFCVLARATRPRVARALPRLPHAGPVRILALGPGRWVVAADVPLSEYGESALAIRLSDLDWVSRAAVAHEAIVEAFLASDAVLPMKLFTMFANDERACRHMASTRAQVESLIARVSGCQEWGVRVHREARQAPAAGRRPRIEPVPRDGAAYLRARKAHHDAQADETRAALALTSDLFAALSAHASDTRQRPAAEDGVAGRVLLDAAFLVPRAASRGLRTLATRRSKALDALGLSMSFTGPWPPYSFMQD